MAHSWIQDQNTPDALTNWHCKKCPYRKKVKRSGSQGGVYYHYIASDGTEVAVKESMDGPNRVPKCQTNLTGDKNGRQEAEGKRASDQERG